MCARCIKLGTVLAAVVFVFSCDVVLNVLYFMDAIQIQEVHEEKDFGVTVSDDLKWDKQCVAVVKKANKLLGMIKRNFLDRSKATILAL